MKSPLQRAASTGLGTDVIEWARVQRDDGRSFAEIARELRVSTGGIVDVTDETIRRWISEAVA